MGINIGNKQKPKFKIGSNLLEPDFYIFFKDFNNQCVDVYLWNLIAKLYKNQLVQMIGIKVKCYIAQENITSLEKNLKFVLLRKFLNTNRLLNSPYSWYAQIWLF